MASFIVCRCWAPLLPQRLVKGSWARCGSGDRTHERAAFEKTTQALRDFFENESSLKDANVPDIKYGDLWQGLEYEGLVANFMEVLGGKEAAGLMRKKCKAQ